MGNLVSGEDFAQPSEPALWSGDFGRSYTARNPVTPENLRARERLWGQILNAMLPESPHSILEVGANVGINLMALRRHLPDSVLSGLEPNDEARSLLPDGVAQTNGVATDIPFRDSVCDLVFTSGCLIHIPADELLVACREIHRVSSRWIVAIEYFNQTPVEIEYRGEMGRLWKRDWGSYYLEHFPDLHPVACGFAWKRLTGLDDVTWWLLEKR